MGVSLIASPVGGIRISIQRLVWYGTKYLMRRDTIKQSRSIVTCEWVGECRGELHGRMDIIEHIISGICK